MLCSCFKLFCNSLQSNLLLNIIGNGNALAKNSPYFEIDKKLMYGSFFYYFRLGSVGQPRMVSYKKNFPITLTKFILKIKGRGD